MDGCIFKFTGAAQPVWLDFMHLSTITSQLFLMLLSVLVPDKMNTVMGSLYNQLKS
jgi:hypothetical protein